MLATKVALNTEALMIENNMPDTKGLISTPIFNKLRKINFDGRMEKATKRLCE